MFRENHRVAVSSMWDMTMAIQIQISCDHLHQPLMKKAPLTFSCGEILTINCNFKNKQEQARKHLAYNVTDAAEQLHGAFYEVFFNVKSL